MQFICVHIRRHHKSKLRATGALGFGDKIKSDRKMQKMAKLITKKKRSSRACSRREIKSDKKESKKEGARKQT